MRRDRWPLPRRLRRAGPRAGRHRRHHRPAEQPGRRRRRLAGGHLHSRTVLARNARQRSSPRPRGTRRSASRSSSSSTWTGSAAPKPRSASSRTSGSTSRSASASTRRRPRSATWRPSPPTRSLCPAGSVGRAQPDHRRRPRASPCRPCRPRSTTSSPSTGEPALFGFSAVGTQRLPQSRRRMERRLPRGIHDRRPGSPARLADPQEPARLHRHRRQRDLSDHPQHLPRPRRSRLRPHLLDLPAGRLGRGAEPRLPQRLEPVRGAFCHPG